MSWQAIIVIRVLFCYFVGSVLLKDVAGMPSKIRNMCWMFFFSLVFSVFFAALYLQEMRFDSNWLQIAASCLVLNSIGCYCWWKAVDIALKDSAIFGQGSYYVSLFCGYLFLGETKFLNPEIITGIILCIAGGIILKNLKKDQIFGWVIIFSIFWGLDNFLTRYFALTVSPCSYLTARYAGTLIGSLILLRFSITRIGAKLGLTEKNQTADKGKIFNVFLLSITNAWIPQILEYKARQQAPNVVADPIFMVSEVAAPIIVIYFLLPFVKNKKIRMLSKLLEEREYLTPSSAAAYSMAIAGAIIIALSF